QACKEITCCKTRRSVSVHRSRLAPALGLRAGNDGVVILSQTDAEIAMRFHPQLEQLECRDTPSTVIFVPNDVAGVPFSAVLTPGEGRPDPNAVGFGASGVAIDHAGVYGAPEVLNTGLTR